MACTYIVSRWSIKGASPPCLMINRASRCNDQEQSGAEVEVWYARVSSDGRGAVGLCSRRRVGLKDWTLMKR